MVISSKGSSEFERAQEYCKNALIALARQEAATRLARAPLVIGDRVLSLQECSWTGFGEKAIPLAGAYFPTTGPPDNI
eukprot:3324127-Amphidinium_carterae.5